MDDTYDLSRRKLMGAAGTIGGAAAIGGSGTLALFSDEETFANNRLTAGKLDLKLAWQELYFGAAAEAEFEAGGVSTSDLFANDVFRTESYPDRDSGGASTAFGDLATEDACTEASLYADSPDDLDPTAAGSYRSMNPDTYDSQAGQPKPLISIQDAKPGDFGFLRLRLLLCDNPGYIWKNGELVTESDNTVNEPELKDTDQNAGAQTGGGELADEVRVRLVQATSGSALDDFLGTMTATSGPELSRQVVNLFDLENAATMREFTNVASPGFPLDADPFDGATAGSVHTVASGEVFLYDVRGANASTAAQADERDCFEADGTAGELGLVWGLPADHANEVQSDSLTATLSYYTEQCRHNDGSKMTPEGTETS